MKAMILAAGLGSRLKPITDTMPKALVKVNGTPLLDITLHRLVQSGFNEIIVNVHHFAEQVKNHLKNSSYPGATIEISDESEELLDTGGAIRKARWFLDGKMPFLVHNVDVISGVDLKAMLKANITSRSLATLAVSHRDSTRYFLFDKELRLRGWENRSTNERLITEGAPEQLDFLAFSGIHVIHPAIFQYLSGQGRFSIVPAYLQLAATHPIHGFLHESGSWFDLGKVENLDRAEEYLKSGGIQ